MTVRIEEPEDAASSAEPAERAGQRLDAALASRGLARSRTHAARLLADGLVTVNGSGAVKASTRVVESDTVEVAGLDHYVSRAAHKLLAALDAFDVDPRGRTALDVGASTGGFTQVLLARGGTVAELGAERCSLTLVDAERCCAFGRQAEQILCDGVEDCRCFRVRGRAGDRCG